MQLPVIIPVLGILLMLFSTSSIPPIIVALLYSEAEISLFIYTFIITLSAGLLFWASFSQIPGSNAKP